MARSTDPMKWYKVGDIVRFKSKDYDNPYWSVGYSPEDGYGVARLAGVTATVTAVREDDGEPRVELKDFSSDRQDWGDDCAFSPDMFETKPLTKAEAAKLRAAAKTRAAKQAKALKQLDPVVQAVIAVFNRHPRAFGCQREFVVELVEALTGKALADKLTVQE